MNLKKEIHSSRHPQIMGVLNLTPDSFFDGGKYLNQTFIRNHIDRMVSEGADIIDVGGESSRPGADPVSFDEELRRISIVFEMIPETKILYSIDTYKPEIARTALQNGFHIINDISGGGANGEMFKIAAEFSVPIIIMHMSETPKTMQENPKYDDVIATIKQFFIKKIKLAKKIGLKDEQIILDPGIGFGKRLFDNDEIIRRLPELTNFGYPILIGASRKSFLQIDNDTPADRLPASISAMTLAMEKGADIIRVHDVQESVKCAKFTNRIINQINPSK